MAIDELAAVLAAIQVSISNVGGDVRELAAELRTRIDGQDRDVGLLRVDVGSHERRITSLEHFRTQLKGHTVGVAVGAALASSGATLGLAELLTRLPL